MRANSLLMTVPAFFLSCDSLQFKLRKLLSYIKLNDPDWWVALMTPAALLFTGLQWWVAKKLIRSRNASLCRVGVCSPMENETDYGWGTRACR